MKRLKQAFLTLRNDSEFERNKLLSKYVDTIRAIDNNEAVAMREDIFSEVLGVILSELLPETMNKLIDMNIAFGNQLAKMAGVNFGGTWALPVEWEVGLVERIELEVNYQSEKFVLKAGKLHGQANDYLLADWMLSLPEMVVRYTGAGANKRGRKVVRYDNGKYYAPAFSGIEKALDGAVCSVSTRITTDIQNQIGG